jgi:hypothetical protein
MQRRWPVILTISVDVLLVALISVELFVWRPAPDLTVTVRNDTDRTVVVQSVSRQYSVQSHSSIQIPPPSGELSDERGWMTIARIDGVKYQIVHIWVNVDGSDSAPVMQHLVTYGSDPGEWGGINRAAVTLSCGSISMWVGTAEPPITPHPGRADACTP